MCSAPLTLNKATHKRQDIRTTNIVPCGKCVKCKRTRQNGWSFRLEQEMKQSQTAIMLTLTYEDQPYSKNGFPTLIKKDLQDFWKRLRKYIKQHELYYTEIIDHEEHDIALKYYACGEYGTNTLRPHYHAILFNLPLALVHNSGLIAEQIWKKGHVHIAPSNTHTIFYVTKYISQPSWTPLLESDDRQPQFNTSSQDLGKNYLSPETVRYHVEGLIPYAYKNGKYIINLPRYYKDKIFSSYEKYKIRKQQEYERQINWEEFVNYDFKNEVDVYHDQIRKHEKERRLSNSKL